MPEQDIIQTYAPALGFSVIFLLMIKALWEYIQRRSAEYELQLKEKDVRYDSMLKEQQMRYDHMKEEAEDRHDKLQEKYLIDLGNFASVGNFGQPVRPVTRPVMRRMDIHPDQYLEQVDQQT